MTMHAQGKSACPAFKAVTFHHRFQRDGLLLAFANAFQAVFGQIKILDIFQAETDGFADVGESFGHSFALRIAAGKRGADREVASVFVRFQNYLEVAVDHFEGRSGIEKPS